ncbi:M50 family metallopeptidase [Melioribacteraceae bacterium 4301-Me]|uniref:M50 family metallopeptidase n=1 Tax=Pyranulibacter aquaticus TaxID=3163344 RepID=UPI003599E8AA
MNTKQKKYLELVILTSSALISLILWDTFILFPIKLFVVLLHEISHGLAAILTGGTVTLLKINKELGGICSTSGGIDFVIASSGYLGSFIFGALIFYSGYEIKVGYWLNILIAIILILFAVNLIEGALGVATAFMYASALIFLPMLPFKNLYFYMLKIIGLLSCIYVLFDIREDLFSSGNFENDAQALSNLTNISSTVWASLWFIFSLIGIYLLFRYSYKKGYKSLR